MRLRSFHGPTLADVMRQVREALGENAIIVSTRDEDGGGVRVTAALDEAPPPPPATITAATTQAEYERDGSEVIEVIAEALTRHEVPHHLAEKLMATATQFANDDPVLALGAAFDAHFQFQPITDDKSTKPLVLIGPPGVGKTLCIAKLATKVTFGKRAVTVISTDIDRAGGLEQLAAFTRLLKLNLIEIEDPHALRDILAMQKGAHIFVDTAGRNPFNAKEKLECQAIVMAAGGEATLVLPAGLDASEGADLANEFSSIGAKRLLVTRLDITKRLGSMLRVAFDSRLPLANYSASSKVTEAPQPFNPVSLARMVLSGLKKQEAEDKKPETGAKTSAR